MGIVVFQDQTAEDVVGDKPYRYTVFQNNPLVGFRLFALALQVIGSITALQVDAQFAENITGQKPLFAVGSC
ncbi:hypothetical protein D3C72_2469780 [compost metagenome]